MDAVSVRPEVDDEIRAIMDETMEAIERGELQPPPMKQWWEPRRENEQTPDYLGRVLEEAGLPDLARNARAAHYDDFHAPREVADGMELVRLVRDLRRAAKEVADPQGHPYTLTTKRLRRERIAVIENAIKRGEFDATKAESDRWAASKDGQETYGALLRDITGKVGRNDPCPCGSSLKWKKCHGRMA